MTFKRCLDFKLQVEAPVESPYTEQLQKFYGLIRTRVFGNIVVYEYAGTWQNMKYLAQIFDHKFNLMSLITYQGKYSKELPHESD